MLNLDNPVGWALPIMIFTDIKDDGNGPSYAEIMDEILDVTYYNLVNQ